MNVIKVVYKAKTNIKSEILNNIFFIKRLAHDQTHQRRIRNMQSKEQYIIVIKKLVRYSKSYMKVIANRYT